MRNDEVVFLVPSRGRPEALRRCLDSIAATVDVPYHVYVAFDDDRVNYKQMKKLRRPNVTFTLFEPRHYFVRMMNRLYRGAKTLYSNMRYFVVCNDDDTFARHGWASYCLDIFDEKFPEGEGLLELFWEGRIHTYLSHVNLFEHHFDGTLYEPCYTQYASDSELHKRLCAMERYVAASFATPADRIVHHNVLTTADTLASETWEAWNATDTQLYSKRNPS